MRIYTEVIKDIARELLGIAIRKSAIIVNNKEWNNKKNEMFMVLDTNTTTVSLQTKIEIHPGVEHKIISNNEMINILKGHKGPFDIETCNTPNCPTKTDDNPYNIVFVTLEDGRRIPLDAEPRNTVTEIKMSNGEIRYRIDEESKFTLHNNICHPPKR